jgi:serine/threonine protein kinase
VYSLGATLYELVTRTPMLDAPDRTELVRRVLDQEPRRPRAVVPQIPRELEAVVLRAVAKDPNRRYPTAAALAVDLLRFVNGLPVTARPTGWWQRLRSRLWRS